MELFSVFVTGANRGIGLGLVKHLVQLPKPPAFVFATYRTGDEPQAFKDIREKFKETQIIPIKMDVTQKSTIEAARKITENVVGDKGLTLLINNSGVIVQQSFPNITEENLLHHFKTNTIGPVMIVQEFLPLLQKAAALRGSDPRMEVSRAAVLNISAGLGSIHDVIQFLNIPGLNVFSYSVSKAALNMSMRVIAENVKKHGILVIMMCPGWVKTDMGSENAPLEVEESVSAMFNTLATFNESHQGTFCDRNGKPYEF